VRNVASVAVMTLVLGSVRLAIAQDYQALVSRFEPATSWSAASQPDLKGFGPIEIRKIIKLLDHSDEFIRSRSAMALGSMGPAASAAVPRLILGLEDRNLEVRVTMADALQAIDRAAAVSALVAALRDEDPAVFTDRVLFSFRIDESVPALTVALRSPRVIVRRNAAKALEMIGPFAKQTGPALLRALKDQDDGVRVAAAMALTRIDPEATAPIGTLLEALKDANHRRRVIQALGAVVIRMRRTPSRH
jgi:HEAT repeat protein